MKQLWLFRICLCLTLFVAANRIFAWTESSTKSKYTLQIQADQEEDDVLVPSLEPTWVFSTIERVNLATQSSYEERKASVSIPLFIRFQNLRL